MISIHYTFCGCMIALSVSDMYMYTFHPDVWFLHLPSDGHIVDIFVCAMPYAALNITTTFNGSLLWMLKLKRCSYAYILFYSLDSVKCIENVEHSLETIQTIALVCRCHILFDGERACILCIHIYIYMPIGYDCVVIVGEPLARRRERK